MTQSSVSDAPKRRNHSQSFPIGKSRLIDVNEVSHRTGMAKSTVWAKVAAGEFVRPIKVKNGVTRWLESEIDKWIDDLVESRRESA